MSKPWKRWKIVLGVLAGLVTLLIVPALIPPGRHYDPGPFLLALKQSAALPVTTSAKGWLSAASPSSLPASPNTRAAFDWESSWP